MMELSTTFRGISTADMEPEKAIAAAKANLRYIDRRSAAKYATGGGPLFLENGDRVKNREEAKRVIRNAISKRSKKGGKNGSRVAEKIMFSLPNSFSGKPAQECLRRIIARLVGDSEAVAYGVIHTDKPSNLHCHILAVDGHESLASARKRRPRALRVRRQDHLRMNDRGRPKEMRELIAFEINAVAAKYGLPGVEHRSFKDRGLDRAPGVHEGPRKRAATERARLNRMQALLSAIIPGGVAERPAEKGGRQWAR